MALSRHITYHSIALELGNLMTFKKKKKILRIYCIFTIFRSWSASLGVFVEGLNETTIFYLSSKPLNSLVPELSNHM